MNKQLLRWILIVPITLLTSFICMFLLMQVARFSMGIPTPTQLYFLFAIGGGSIAFVWVLSSYFVAPSYKIQATWISFLIGTFIVTITNYPSIIYLVKYFKLSPWIVAELFAIITGLLLTLYLQHNFNKKGIKAKWIGGE
ncbi:MAG: hypothetical protein COA95_04970 [Methylophaga sp.]|nr:MAG: hypothetical protein COA95_04970 [Methylophaga sp.]